MSKNQFVSAIIVLGWPCKTQQTSLLIRPYSVHQHSLCAINPCILCGYVCLVSLVFLGITSIHMLFSDAFSLHVGSSHQSFAAKDEGNVCVIEHASQVDAANDAHHYRHCGMQQTRWLEAESRKYELGQHRKDGVEDVDGKGVSANVMEHFSRFIAQKGVEFGRKGEEAEHACKHGEGCPVLECRRSNQEKEGDDGPKACLVNVGEVGSELPYHHAHEIVCGKPDVEQGCELGHENDERGENGKFGHAAQLRACVESHVIKRAAHHHEMQKPIWANGLYEQHLRESRPRGLRKSVSHGQIERHNRKSRHHDGISQDNFCDIACIGLCRLVHVNQKSGDNQERRHEECQDGILYKREVLAEVNDVNEYDKGDEQCPEVV